MAPRKNNNKGGKKPVEHPVENPVENPVEKPVEKPVEDDVVEDVVEDEEVPLTSDAESEAEQSEEEKPVARKKIAVAKPKKGKSESETDGEAKPDKKPRLRTPVVTGTQFSKAFEQLLKERLKVTAKGAEVMEVLFDTIKALAKQTVEETEEDKMLALAKKGMTINLPAFGGQKNTAKFSITLSKTKAGEMLPRTTMTLHKMYKDVWVSDLATVMKPALDVLPKPE